MKELIVMGAVIVYLLTFPLQYALEQRNHHNISQFQQFVHVAKEKAKQKGYFTPAIITELKNNITTEFKNIDESEILVNVTITKKYRSNTFDERELIHYRIGVPIKKLIASNVFWGITDAENSYMYIIDRYAASELTAQ